MLPTTIARAIGIAVVGWVGGNAVVDSVQSATQPTAAVTTPAYSHVQPAVESGSGFSPFLLLSIAVLCVALAYAIKTTLNCWRSHQHNHNAGYYH